MQASSSQKTKILRSNLHAFIPRCSSHLISHKRTLSQHRVQTLRRDPSYSRSSPRATLLEIYCEQQKRGTSHAARTKSRRFLVGRQQHRLGRGVSDHCSSRWLSCNRICSLAHQRQGDKSYRSQPSISRQVRSVRRDNVEDGLEGSH